MGDDNWCIDLDNLCLPDDHADMIEAIQAAEEGTNTARPNSITNRGRALSGSTEGSGSNNKKEGKKERSSSQSLERSSSGSEKEPSKKSSYYGLPFNLSNLSFSSAKKDRTATASINGDKDKNHDTATVYSEESSNANQNNREINANVIMISGCQDSQTSADVSNVSSFSLPNPNGRAGGACTSALLKVMYSNQAATTELTFVQVLGKMRKILSGGRYSQIPQLTSSQKMNVTDQFYIVPPNCQGTKRAVLIGINYTGQNGQLSGCHNDCLNMKDYIMNVWGFEEDNIVILMDDGINNSPTRDNILQAYEELAELTGSGDVAFCHYSGHGGRVRDDDFGEEEDGYDETLVPVDYSSAGQIRDDDLYSSLVCAMPSGSSLVSLMDCCHSATVLDLPYKYRANTTDGHQLNLFSTDGGNVFITIFLFIVVVIVIIVLAVRIL